ncbi:unnamed protein product, partial [Adineta steineri]
FVEVNSNTTRLRRLDEHFQKRKLIWIMFFIILIVVIIVIATIIAIINKTKREKTSTATTSTIEITSSTTSELLTTTTTTRTTTTTMTTTTTTSELLTTTTTSEQFVSSVTINNNTKWKQNACTVAGGNGLGSKLNELDEPQGIYVDNDDQNIYIADTGNHRIVRWEFGANIGTIVAGGNGPGNEIFRLNTPVDVVLDKDRKYIIICDQTNARVTRWSRQNNQDRQLLIPDILCWGLAIDNNGDLYISDFQNHEVRRFQQGDKEGILVAGGNNYGDGLNQLNQPKHIFVDENHSVYVADYMNNRVVKWMKNANEGILVAPGEVSNEDPSSMSKPIGVIVDHIGNIYVSTNGNHQIMRWSPGATAAIAVVGEEEVGWTPTHLLLPRDLSFDRHGNLYVVDMIYTKIQKFDIDLD